MNTDFERTARSREQECLLESRALQLRLRPLRRANWITVVLPAVILGLAGAGIVIDGSNAIWRMVGGWLTALASLLVIIHKARNCDFYQAEAKQLQKRYEGLAKRYRTTYQVARSDAEARLRALDEDLAILTESAEVDVGEKYRSRAQEIVPRSESPAPSGVALSP